MASPTKNPSTRTEVIGFPTGTQISGLVRESYEHSTFADIEEVRDEDNSTGVEIISNPGTVLNVSAVVQAAFTLPTKGTVVTVNSVKYLVHDAKIAYSRTTGKLTMELRKPDSITYT